MLKEKGLGFFDNFRFWHDVSPVDEIKVKSQMRKACVELSIFLSSIFDSDMRSHYRLNDNWNKIFSSFSSIDPELLYEYIERGIKPVIETPFMRNTYYGSDSLWQINQVVSEPLLYSLTIGELTDNPNPDILDFRIFPDAEITREKVNRNFGIRQTDYNFLGIYKGRFDIEYTNRPLENHFHVLENSLQYYLVGKFRNRLSGVNYLVYGHNPKIHHRILSH